MTIMFNIGFCCYLVALVLSAINSFHTKRGLSIASTASLAAGVLVQTAYIAVRWAEAGRAPFSNMFESLVLFAWAVAVVYLVLRIRTHVPALEAAASLLAVLALAYASAFESDIKPLMPALQSNWLSVHVFTCFLGYAGFAVSFVASIGYLIVSREGAGGNSELQNAFDTAMTKTISFGFLFLAVGIITGAVWANSAWGTYWSWDPKETWSLITWLIYAGFLHCRFMRGWRGKRAAWISIIGFASVLFTYVGVNFLLSGLHSYAK
ncbi:MAG: c-type cytochrome biogenesis protein CcsB [Kiritimatiellia bacterium]|jgi:cytochrome c-type biogenesis protein CcsB|nr:c-type cytochrome biogenesis protein CcsB [Kiritimatiellia bacterium]MDP6847370.1 c-type cytochrome biogenesis protein CcsB [Kiritimatiellia bacterium]